MAENKPAENKAAPAAQTKNTEQVFELQAPRTERVYKTNSEAEARNMVYAKGYKLLKPKTF